MRIGIFPCTAKQSFLLFDDAKIQTKKTLQTLWNVLVKYW